MALALVIISGSLALDAVLLWVFVRRCRSAESLEAPEPLTPLIDEVGAVPGGSSKILIRGIGKSLLQYGEQQTKLIDYLHKRHHALKDEVNALKMQNRVKIFMLQALYEKLIGPLPTGLSDSADGTQGG